MPIEYCAPQQVIRLTPATYGGNMSEHTFDILEARVQRLEELADQILLLVSASASTEESQPTEPQPAPSGR
jgi:hypothetical protein